jgi:hypothetical protein
MLARRVDARHVSHVAEVAAQVAAAGIVSAKAGVRIAQSAIDAIVPHAKQRQAELADHDGSADHRCN